MVKEMQAQIHSPRSRFRAGILLLSLLILTSLFIGFSAAADDEEPVIKKVNIETDWLDFTGTAVTEQGGYFAKTYDGTTGLGGTLAFQEGTVFAEIDPADDVTVAIESAQFTSKDCGEGNNIRIDFSLQGDSQKTAKYRIESIYLPARITRLPLEWTEGFSATASVTYQPGKTSYTVTPDPISSAAFRVEGKGYSSELLSEIEALTVSVPESDNPVITADRAGTYAIGVKVSLDNNNFIVSNPTVTVTVEPIVIDRLVWNNADDFAYGEHSDPISVTPYSGLTAYSDIVTVTLPEGFGTVGSHTLRAVLEDKVNFRIADSATSDLTKIITVTRKDLSVTMEDRSVTTDGRTPQNLTVVRLGSGDPLPEDVASRISYQVNGLPFAGTVETDVYEVTAYLPADSGYRFLNAEGKEISHLTATLTVTTDHIRVPVNSESGEQVSTYILTAVDGGLFSKISVRAEEKTGLKIPAGTRNSQAFSILLTGTSEGESYSVLVPVSSDLYKKGCGKLDEGSVYVYSKDGTPLKAVENGYTVVAGEGYYRISGLTGTGATFVIAPQFQIPFFQTAPGILLIFLLVLVVLTLMVLIGLWKRRVMRSEPEAPITIDDEGVLPEQQAAESGERQPTQSAEEFLDELAEEKAEKEYPEEGSDEQTDKEKAALATAVTESTEALKEEANQTPAEKEVAEGSVEEDTEETFTGQLADQTAEDLAGQDLADETPSEDVSGLIAETVAETAGPDKEVPAVPVEEEIINVVEVPEEEETFTGQLADQMAADLAGQEVTEAPEDVSGLVAETVAEVVADEPEEEAPVEEEPTEPVEEQPAEEEPTEEQPVDEEPAEEQPVEEEPAEEEDTFAEQLADQMAADLAGQEVTEAPEDVSGLVAETVAEVVADEPEEEAPVEEEPAEPIEEEPTVVESIDVVEEEPIEEEDTFAEQLADQMVTDLTQKGLNEGTPIEDVTDLVAEAFAEVVADEPAEEAPVEEEPAEPIEEAPVEEAPAEEEVFAEQLADQVATDLSGQEVAETPEDVSGLVAETVAEVVSEEAPVEEAPAEEEPAVEALAEVTEEAPAEEVPEDEDAVRFAQIPPHLRGKNGSLLFVDTMEKPELYREILDLHEQGKAQVVHRYRRSYQAKLAMSQGRVQDFYSGIKNALLAYKGVKARKSWNYEAFNRGRVQIAKIIPKTKTLYVYLALDPQELVDTKYGIVDVSEKRKYAATPVLMKVKGERKYKYVLELIAKICAENLELKKLDKPEEDFRVPYMTQDELIEAGLIRHLAAAAPLDGEVMPESEPIDEAEDAEDVEEDAEDEETTEEAPEEATEEATEEVTEEATEEVTEEATEEATEEVTEEATEEVPEEATEEVTEEAPAEEEIPAEAPADEEPPKQV